ncbi:MAG TPA: PAS domain S-box protein, partial [Gemmatimonadaceae bacterium]|nr:PAS domain S-box protein [Gemmatimonadaceae bacterium]
MLARMTSLFGSGVDLGATLHGVAELLVPDMAQAVAIDLREGDQLRRVALSTAIPGTDANAPPDLMRETGLSLDDPRTRALIDREQALVVQVRSRADYPFPPTSPERDAWYQTLLPLSIILAPLRAHGASLGVMQLVSLHGARTYTDDDRRLVEDVAQRAAFAIHNAQLVHDLTRELALRSRALTRLEESERRYRQIFEGNPLPLWIYDLETLRFVDVNPAAVKAYGYSRDEFLAMTLLDLRPASEYDKLYAAMREMQEGTYHPGIFTHRRKDGTLLLADVHAHDVEVEGRRCRMVQAIDLTERMRAFESLRVAEERHRLLTRVTKEAIFEWNAATDTVEWSHAVHDLFRFAPHEVLPTREWFRSRVHPDDLRRTEDLRRLLLESGAETMTTTLRFRCGDESYAAVESRMVIARRDGRVVRIIGSLADVTLQQRVSEQLAIAQRMEAVGRLAGGVAHDFNNLLTAIRGFATFALDDQLPSSRARDDIEQILQAADRAAALTRQLLAFSRRQVLQPQTVSVNVILRNLQKMLTRVLGEDVELQTFLDEELATVVVDAGQLEQV